MINKTWNSTQVRFNFFFTFTFRSKADYLVFRQQWRENYAALSKSNRDLKASIKDTMRKHEYAGSLQSNLRALKSEASVQLAMRLASKQEAARQYQEAKQIAK